MALALVGVGVGFVVRHATSIANTVFLLEEATALTATLCKWLGWTGVACLIVLGVVCWNAARAEWRARHAMTRAERRAEAREAGTDPELAAARRRARQAWEGVAKRQPIGLIRPSTHGSE